MQSATTSKPNITVRPSLYAAICVFSLYSIIIILLPLVFGLDWITIPIFFLLLITAIYGASKAYQQQFQIKLNENSEVVVYTEQKVVTGIISATSFYNGLFISLRLTVSVNSYIAPKNNTDYFVIYRDAVSKKDFRLLARAINFGRDKCT